MAHHSRTIRFWLRALPILFVVATLLTPRVIAMLDRPTIVSHERLESIREHVRDRDEAMAIYIEKHKMLDIALATLYDELGVDRIQFDIDLTTGAFIPYRNGRAPDVPPTLTQRKE